MELQEAPATPTGEFRPIDDTVTFEIFDGNSAIQNRKRRRSSLRRVSFAEQPSIHVFARDDDYETPPEGTMSHLSAQSTPTSVSRSPHRRSERLAARGGRQDENEVDKENASVGIASNGRPSRRGRRPLALRDTQKEEEFLKPSNWLDDREHSAFGSCDDNSGPVDVRHITFDNQRVEVDDDDNMTMDSQTFNMRMLQMKQLQPRHTDTTWTRTTGKFSDMESIHEQHTETAVAWLGRQAPGSRGRLAPEEYTGHGRISDMSESSFDELSIFKVLAKRRSAAKESSFHDPAENAGEGRDKCAAKESSVHDSAENAGEGRDKWAEDDAQSQGRIPSMEFRRSGSLLDVDDVVSMDTSSPQSTGGRCELLVNDREQDADMRDLRDLEGSDGSQLQGMQSFKQQGQPELQAARPITRKGTSMFNDDDSGAMEASSQSHADGNDSTMEIDSGTDERLFVRDVQSSAAKPFLWVDKDESMDMSDEDMMEKYQEGITEAMPKLDFVLGGYNCDSPSAEPLNRILQRKSGIDDEHSPVYGVTTEIDTKKALSSRKCDDVARSGGAEEKEIFSNRGLEEDTDELHFNIGKKRTGFQNPEDTFSFRGHHKSAREDSISPSMEQNVMPKPIFSKVREIVNTIEANLRNPSPPHNPGRNFQDEDTTGEYTGQHDWRAEVSSDMSTTPLSPRRPNYFQRLATKPQSVPVLTETRLTDSPSFQDGITAAIPNVQDLLAADARTPESELGWNPRKIDWSAQHSTCQASGDEEGLRHSETGKTEDQIMHSMPEKLCTPTAQDETNHIFECMTEEAAKTLNQLSHSKEVRNSIASKMLLRMMSLQDDARAQAESSSDEESQHILRRTLQFQPESDGQSQAQSLIGDAEQQIGAEDPDGRMEVESVKNVDEETNSTESRMESLRQESRRQKLLQEMQAAEERLVALERRSEELRERAQDCHKAIAKRCRSDSCFMSNESTGFCSQAHVSELRKRCELLHCMQGWVLKTTKTGDYQVLHEFKYWSLLTHSIFERKENKIEATVARSSIDLDEEQINQVYRHMNASLAWRWFLSGSEEVIQPQSLFYHVQGVNFKVVMLMDLMEEVNRCRKYLVIPHFRLQTGTRLHLGIQFSNSELLFDFVVLLDIRQVNHMRYSNRDKLDSATQMNQKLDCTVEMESAGRFIGKKIGEAEIKSAVSSVVPGRQLLLRVCASINALIMRIKDSLS